MTDPRFGKVTPLQMCVLKLAGEPCGGYDTDEEPTDTERVKLMNAGRDSLRQHTGVDLGYDLQAWHEFLLNSEEHRKEYTHRYAWSIVRRTVLELLAGEERLRRQRLAEDSAQTQT